MKFLGFDATVRSADDEAALSEGFCPRCLSRLGEPVFGCDDGEAVARALPCSSCGLINLEMVPEPPPGHSCDPQR